MFCALRGPEGPLFHPLFRPLFRPPFRPLFRPLFHRGVSISRVCNSPGLEAFPMSPGLILMACLA